MGYQSKKGGAMKFKFFNSIFILFIYMILFSGCNSQTVLEGKWVGCDIRKPLIDWVLTIRGNTFTLIREDNNRWYTGRLKLNNNCVHRKIDLEVRTSHFYNQNRLVLFGIYEISGDILALATTQPGMQFRPQSFDEAKNALVFNFTRS